MINSNACCVIHNFTLRLCEDVKDVREPDGCSTAALAAATPNWQSECHTNGALGHGAAVDLKSQLRQHRGASQAASMGHGAGLARPTWRRPTAVHALCIGIGMPSCA